MKKLFTLLLLTTLALQGVFAVTVKVTMNTVSTTMSLINKATSVPVAVGEPATRVYTFDAEPGTYVLTAYATNGTIVNGTIELNVTDEAQQTFSVLTCTAYATNSGWTADNDYTVIANVSSIFGEQRVHTTGNSITAGRKTFLALNGDSYYVELVPSSAHEAAGYMTLYKSSTLTANATINGAIAMGGDYTVTVPSDANVYIGIKSAHFAPFKQVEAKSIKTEGSNKLYTYRLANGQQYNFRTWKPGGLTQGGIFYYSTDASKRPTLTFTTADYASKSPKFIDHDVKSNGGYNVADIYLNINPQNHLKMQIGDKYDVTGFRTWQILESTTNNYFIEPDYHYTVQSLTPGKNASDIISMERTDTDTDQWSNLQAVGNGTVLVTVTYDAIALNQYSNTNVKSTFLGGEYWSALWPENTGVFVVTVGEDATGITPNFLVDNNHENALSEKMAGNNVDADFDVFYYKKGTAGYAYTFKPEGAASVKVAYPTIGENVATYAGFGTEGVTKNEDGSYTILLKNGRQIVALYDEAGKAQYQVLNAKEVEMTVENASRPGATDYMLGEQVDVKFNTLYHPAHKLAGINNFSAAIEYDGATGTSNQYLFASTDAAQKLSITLPSVVTPGVPATFGSGAIKVTGFGDPIGNHRNTSRTTGRNANFTAVQHTCYFGVLPEISIPLTIKNINLKFTGVEGMNVELTTSNGTKLTANTDGSYTLNSYGTYNYKATASGYGVLRSSIKIDSDAPIVENIQLPIINDQTWDGTTKKEPSQVDGVYQISTGYELAWLSANSNGKSASLTADIDLAGFEFTPIGLASASAFNGTFDGQGHSVKNLYVKRTANYAGLFGYINAATIKNLSVYGEVNGTASVAGIAGYVNGACTFENVTNHAKVNATTAASYVAGIAGNVRAVATTITNAVNTGTISGVNYVGGIYNYYTTAANATVTNVLNVGEIIGTQTGAIRGLNTATGATGKITNAFAPKAYFNDTKTTIVTAEQLASGEIAHRLGEAWGQKIGKEAYPVIGGKTVYYDETKHIYTNTDPNAPKPDPSSYVLRTLTFEDRHYVGSGNYVCSNDWSTLIDEEQYGGLLLYGDSGMGADKEEDAYTWCDENNTWLQSTINEGLGSWCYWNGGCAISNYTNGSIAEGSSMTQLEIPLSSGHNGSDNFAVCYGYYDGNSYSSDSRPIFTFGDGKSHIIDHAYITNTCYLLHSITSGDGFNSGANDNTFVDLVAEGYDAEGVLTKTATLRLVDGKKYINEWTKFDLSTLGEIATLKFNFNVSEDQMGDYGINTPAYFAIDDIAVRQPLSEIEDEVTLPIVNYERKMSSEWGTICLPYATESNEKVQYYVLSKSSEEFLTFTPVESIAAGQPAVFQKLSAEGSLSISAENVTLKPAQEYEKSAETEVSGWQMKGTFNTITVDHNAANIYYIAQNKFYHANMDFEVKAFRAWFETTSGTNARMLQIMVDADQTIILDMDGEGNLIPADGKYVENGKVIVIKNGKKYNINGTTL